MEFKVLIADVKSGKTYTKEVKDQEASSLIGKKIGDTLDGSSIGLGGYELIVTGGSDKSGFPMKRGFHGGSAKRLLLAEGPGFNPKSRGMRKKKRVTGDHVSENCSQLNTKVTKYGPTGLDKLIQPPAKEGEGEEKEAPKEAPKEEAKEEGFTRAIEQIKSGEIEDKDLKTALKKWKEAEDD